MAIEISYDRITDPLVREALQKVEEYLNDFDVLKGEWKFFEITFSGAVTNFKYPHNLPFIPRDIIQTSKTGSGSITWNYAEFDKDNLNITTTGALTVRALIGSCSM